MNGRSEGMPEKYKDFICPCCGSRDYLEHYASIGDPMLRPIGPRNNKRFRYCSCADCTVIFIDPKAFSNKRKNRMDSTGRLHAERGAKMQAAGSVQVFFV